LVLVIEEEKLDFRQKPRKRNWNMRDLIYTSEKEVKKFIKNNPFI